MNKEQFQNNMMMFENGIIDYVTFTSRCIEYINSLESENEKLKDPKPCLTCSLFEDNSCIHPEVEDFYTPQYIHHSGCGLHELKDH